jgi:hypothetical protein
MADAKSDWQTLEEISARCGLSTRTLRRRLEEPRKGVKIETDYRSIPSRKPLLILSPATVKIITADVLHPVPMPTANSDSAIVKKTHRDTGIMPQADIAPLLQALIRPRFEPPSKPWLTVPEAAEWSGLPENLLRKALKEKALAGIKFHGWRVHSDDLASYCDSLKETGIMSLPHPEE